MMYMQDSIHARTKTIVMTQGDTICFENVRPFLRSLVGIPYEAWNGHYIPFDGSPPFWASPVTIENDDWTHFHLGNEETRTCNCAGLLNLLARNIKIPIPQVPVHYPGGSHAWFLFLQSRQLLEIFHENARYPAGSLLLRQYKHINDQGHIAILWSDSSKAIHAECLHCYYPCGVRIDKTVGDSHRQWLDGHYYTHVCRWDRFVTCIVHESL